MVQKWDNIKTLLKDAWKIVSSVKKSSIIVPADYQKQSTISPIKNVAWKLQLKARRSRKRGTGPTYI
jgi:hypothetical protein